MVGNCRDQFKVPVAVYHVTTRRHKTDDGDLNLHGHESLMSPNVSR
jgi:hypothetical protein